MVVLLTKNSRGLNFSGVIYVWVFDDDRKKLYPRNTQKNSLYFVFFTFYLFIVFSVFRGKNLNS